jgi:transcriptional regulator with XRE-family HTH domain
VNKRFAKLIKYLIAEGLAKNQSEVAALLGYSGNSQSMVSQIMNGKKKVPLKIFVTIEEKFPSVNISWLKTGQGEVFKSNDIGHAIVGTNNKISSSSITVNKNTHTLEQRIADLEMIIKTQKELIEALKNNNK